MTSLIHATVRASSRSNGFGVKSARPAPEGTYVVMVEGSLSVRICVRIIRPKNLKETSGVRRISAGCIKLYELIERQRGCIRHVAVLGQ
jgi:hypothetical protein